MQRVGFELVWQTVVVDIEVVQAKKRRDFKGLGIANSRDLWILAN